MTIADLQLADGVSIARAGRTLFRVRNGEISELQHWGVAWPMAGDGLPFVFVRVADAQLLSETRIHALTELYSLKSAALAALAAEAEKRAADLREYANSAAKAEQAKGAK